MLMLEVERPAEQTEAPAPAPEPAPTPDPHSRARASRAAPRAGRAPPLPSEPPRGSPVASDLPMAKKPTRSRMVPPS